MTRDDFSRLQFCDDFSTADPNAPVTERAKLAMARLARYSRIMDWARSRYTRDGVLIVAIGGAPAPFTRIERAAWQRYAA